MRDRCSLSIRSSDAWVPTLTVAAERRRAAGPNLSDLSIPRPSVAAAMSPGVVPPPAPASDGGRAPRPPRSPPTMISRLWMLPLAIAATVLPREHSRRDVRLPSPHPAISYELRNGRWFDGRTFIARTMWVTEERFRVSRPARVDSVIDLAGRFVVPPFADAHTHALGDGSDHEALVRTWMRRGIFYVRNTNSTPLRSATAQPFVNQPRGIDVIYSYGGLTASGGHPVQIYRSIVVGGSWPGWTEAQLEGQAFHTIDSRADLEAKWPRIVAAKPAFLKVYLEHSEEFAKRRDDPAFFGKRGLDPALLSDVVRRAHAAGLTVSAHVTAAADFRAALAAGIDELSHLPLERITADDAARA